MIAGRPMSASASRACSSERAIVARGHVEADPGHRLAEQLAVLGLVDGLAVEAPISSHAQPLQRAVLGQRHGGVEGRLPAHGRQQRVGPLLLDDLGDDRRRDRLDIGDVGRLRVGHDRGRVRVDQDDPVAFLAQRLAGLGARIVELAGLADDDRPGADDQDRVDVGTFGHDQSGNGAAGKIGAGRSDRRLVALDQVDEAVEQVARIHAAPARPRDGTARRTPGGP